MAAVLYSGYETLTFMGYLDLATGRTLTCVPGGTYDIAPVNIGDLDVPDTGHFTLLLPPDIPEEQPEETPEEGEER